MSEPDRKHNVSVMKAVMHAIFLAIFDAIGVATAAWLAFKVSKYGHRERGLPPGPPTTFFLGNILDIPAKRAYMKLVDWSREYGEIYSFKVGHQTTVVLNSPAAVQAVMEKGSRITQDRPTMWLFDEYLYHHDHLIASSVSSKVNHLRRVFVTFLNSTSASQYLPLQYAESCQLLYDITREPGSFFTGIKRFTVSQIFSLSYGVRVPRIDSPLAALFYDSVDTTNALLANVAPLLDLVPILRILPNWIVSWRKQADYMNAQERHLTTDLLKTVHARRKSCSSANSFMEQILDDPDEFGLSENMMHTFPLLMLQAGADTIASALLSTILLLVGQDDVVEKAHAELDAVVGRDRLPVIEDMESLPYIRGIIRESERLRPTNPLGFPHVATEDQVYSGYIVPKGAIVMLNTWALGHDPALFPDPEKFLPERWMVSDAVSHPDTWPFGVGRRSCPGMHLARNTVAIVISRLLWAFDIKPQTNSVNGNPIEVDTLDYAEGLVLCPNKFKADFKLRSTEHGESIQHELRHAIPLLNVYKLGMEREDVAYVEKMRSLL